MKAEQEKVPETDLSLIALRVYSSIDKESCTCKAASSSSPAGEPILAALPLRCLHGLHASSMALLILGMNASYSIIKIYTFSSGCEVRCRVGTTTQLLHSSSTP